MRLPYNNILVVDLNEETSKTVSLKKSIFRYLLGGRGLAAFILYNLINYSIDPLSPSNPLLVFPGLLVGTGLSTASKTIIASRSPLTGILGRSSVGAKLGAALKMNGYDGLVIKGSANRPSILIIDENGVRIERFESLWGLEISKARRTLYERYPGYASCIIGPAGENLSRIALIDCDGRQAGRTGLGAVMGSKKLKAILVKYPTRFRERLSKDQASIVRDWARRIPATEASKKLVEYGTPIVLNSTESQGVLPSLNWHKSTLEWCGDRETYRYRYVNYARMNRIGRLPCIHCNRPCSQVIQALNPILGKNEKMDGPEYELLYSLGTNLGFCDPEKPASLALLADEYGFDGISLGTTLGWFLDMKEKGLVPEDLLKPYESVSWGDLEGLTNLVKDMAYRSTALASILADGERLAAEKLGNGMDLAIHVKGLSLPAYDARGLKGLALGYAVGSRGGDHLTSGMYALELGGKLWLYEKIDPLEYKNKPFIVKYMEDMFAVFDNLGVCKFSRNELDKDELTNAVNIFTGYNLEPWELTRVGERTITLERLVNLLLGFSPREEDMLPRRLYTEPINDGPKKGEVVDLEKFLEMRREYYLLRGWDPDTGVPRKETLAELGLDKILSFKIEL